MNEKQELFDLAIFHLDRNEIENIHIPNRVFGIGYTAPKGLKYFPDIAFLFNKVFYMREFAIKNRHPKRKDEQLEKMKRWKNQGANIKIIKTRKQLINDFKKIGVIR